MRPRVRHFFVETRRLAVKLRAITFRRRRIGVETGPVQCLVQHRVVQSRRRTERRRTDIDRQRARSGYIRHFASLAFLITTRASGKIDLSGRQEVAEFRNPLHHGFQARWIALNKALASEVAIFFPSAPMLM